jgi:hypothetical protein
MKCVDCIYTSQKKLHHADKKPTTNIIRKKEGGGCLECLPKLKNMQTWLIWHTLILESWFPTESLQDSLVHNTLQVAMANMQAWTLESKPLIDWKSQKHKWTIL